VALSCSVKKRSHTRSAIEDLLCWLDVGHL
jgi:hypothetical protein